MNARRALAGVAFAVLLAACQSASVAPSPSASKEPTPSPTPEAPDPADIIDAFLEIVTDPDLTMHVIADGTLDVTVGGQSQTLTIGLDMEISGEDGIGQTIVDMGAADITVDMLLIDGRAYADDNGTWTEIPGYEPSSALNPFASLSGAEDVEYRDSEMRAGRRLHNLESLVWLGGELAAMEAQGWTDPVIDNSRTDIVVDDQGVPDSLDFTGRVSGRYGDEVASVEFAVTYDFTDVGEPVELPAPPEPAVVFPDPIPGQAVYDLADVLSPAVEASMESQIAAIQERSGVEVVVYLDLDPTATADSSLAAARALILQWRIGGLSGNGFVILVYFTEDRLHGQMSTFAGTSALALLPVTEQTRLRDDVMATAFLLGEIERGIVDGLDFVDQAIP